MQMQRILNKRVIRDLKDNFLRYFALFLLIAMGMYLIVSIVGAAESIMIRVSEAGDRNQVEDGEFTVFVPLDTNSIEELRQSGITLEEEFYLDYLQKDQSVIRIYKNRESINLVQLDAGRLAKQKNEIVIEKHYATKHNLVVGSSILIAGKEYEVTGLGSTSDYDAVLRNMSDPCVDSSIFGTAFVSQECYQELLEEGNSSKTEEYVYSYRLNQVMSSEELKDYLCQLELDRNKVTDPYFNEMIQEIEEQKLKIQDGVSQLSDGANELQEGLTELTNQNDELNSGTNRIFKQLLANVSDELSTYGLNLALTEQNYKEQLSSVMDQVGSSNPHFKIKIQGVMKELDGFKKYQDGIETYTDGTKRAEDGTSELQEGIVDLQEETDDLIDEYFDIDLDNLTQFVEKRDNPRIAASIDDVQINKQAGMVAGIIVMILFTYVISVFVIHGIEKESSIIGALYAQGVTKKQLLGHYLRMPILITLFGGLVGTGIGFSPLGVATQTQNTESYFSLPNIATAYPVYLVVYGIIMPPLVAALVNFLVISKKLSLPALALIRNEQKNSKISNISLGNLSFVPCFQIRQFLREIRTSFTVIMGMFIAMLILMLGVDCYVICYHMSNQNKQDATYAYMYTYKYPTKEVPKNGEACYIESLKKEIYGSNLDVSLLGIDKENPFFKFKVNTGKNKVAISQAVAVKYNLSVGNKLVLTDEVNELDYGFTIDKIVPYSIGLYVFMDIDSMRDLFHQEEDFYNLVLADHDLKIDSGRLYATTTMEDINKSADVFQDNMWSLIISMVVVSIIIFIVVMYLMIKVMIDRSSFSISLMKVFGFKEKEVRKLYLDGNFILIALAAAICIPGSKWIMDTLYPYLVSNVACGVNLTFGWKLYLLIYVSVMICYVIINKLLVIRLRKLLPAQVLKNRE